MPQKVTPIKRRVAPSVPLKLDLEDDSGAKFSKEFRLSFDFNAAALIQEKTSLKLTEFSSWRHIDEPIFQSVMFWAAVLAQSPEYEGDEGLSVLRSYMDEKNSEAIVEALWQAYLLYLPKEKREFVVKLKADAEKERDAGRPTIPATPPATPETVAAPIGSNSGPLLDTTSPLPMTSSAS
jgi:hypothetical protein